VEGVTYRVQIVVPGEKFEYVAQPRATQTAVVPNRVLELRHYTDDVLQAAEYTREELPVGAQVSGPAVIREPLSTIFVCPGQLATVGGYGELSIERATENSGGDQ
jgi:N-methylhydantoinase A